MSAFFGKNAKPVAAPYREDSHVRRERDLSASDPKYVPADGYVSIENRKAGLIQFTCLSDFNLYSKSCLFCSIQIFLFLNISSYVNLYLYYFNIRKNN